MEQTIEILETDSFLEKRRGDGEPVSWIFMIFTIFFSTGKEIRKNQHKE